VRMISSKNMGSVSELTLMADVRPELCEIRRTMTHGTRLRLLLRTLYGIRRSAVEETEGRRLAGPLESLEFLHFVRFALLDNDSKFLLGVTFDGAWEPYIRAIAERAGPLLDVIFCHTVDYNAHSSDRGYPIFSKWVRSHQVEADFFFADSPGTTAKDVQLLKDFHQRMCGEPPPPDPLPPPTADDVRRGIKALHQLYALDELFPATHEKNFLRRTAQMVLASVMPALEHRMGEYAWIGTGQQRVHEAAMNWVKEEPSDGSFDSVAVPRPKVPKRDPIETMPSPAHDVQGNILEGYPEMTHGATLLMRITDLSRAQSFLRGLRLTCHGDALPDVTCNLGLTYRGLEKLGVPEDALEQLPFEFREGMAARAGWLGDLGPNHPARWRLPKRNWPPDRADDALRVRLSSVDFVIQLQTSRPNATGRDHAFEPDHPLHDYVLEHFGALDDQGVQLLAVEPTRHVGHSETAGQPWGMEHFGYLDGVSQPTVEALADGKGLPARDRVALGELVLGYGDDRDGAAAEHRPDFLRNGSFQVVRKLSQDVGRFCAVIDENDDWSELAERMMGRPLARSMTGRPLAKQDPLVDAAEKDRPQLLHYDFGEGGRGDEAPPESHVRRSNPRSFPADNDARVRFRSAPPLPRIARRGMSYGSEFSKRTADEERGLLFSCFNASLADQFEVVQRWLAGANSSGVVGLRNDAFLGLPQPGEHKRFCEFDAEGQVVRSVDLGTEPLVKLEWGLYLFTPAPSALEKLTAESAAELAVADLASDDDVRDGEAVIGRMETLLQVERARDPERAWFLMANRWKVLIEDLSARETMRKVWAAIRARGGLLETPYGVLVGSRELIGQIFSEPRDYSVSGYWDRMRDSLGEHYLGMDPKQAPMAPHANLPARIQQDRYVAAVDRDRYAREATLANAWISRIDESAAFDHAYRTARAVLDDMIWAGAPTTEDPEDASDVTVVDVARLVDFTVAAMCTEWFDLPQPMRREFMTLGEPFPETAHNPDNFKSTARYIFSPNPTEFVEQDGRAKGTELLEGATAYVEEVLRGETAGEEGTLLAALVEAKDDLVESGIDEGGFAGFCAGILLGTIHGFVGPVGGSLTSLLNEWIKSRELWRQQLALFEAFPDPTTSLRWDDVAPLLLGAVEEGMRIQPFPYVLHRVPVRDVVLRQRPRARGDRSGGPAPDEFDVTIEAGTKVVLGVVSAAHDTRAKTGPVDMPIGDLLFGGAYPRGTDGAAYPGEDASRKTGLHACPGKAIGMGTILGVFSALAQAGNLRRIAPLKLDLDPFGPWRKRNGAGDDRIAARMRAYAIAAKKRAATKAGGKQAAKKRATPGAPKKNAGKKKAAKTTAPKKKSARSQTVKTAAKKKRPTPKGKGGNIGRSRR